MEEAFSLEKTFRSARLPFLIITLISGYNVTCATYCRKTRISSQEAQMDEFFQKVTSQQDPFKKLASYIPGFGGYVERQNRRDADKLLRDTVARRFDEQWKRASQLQVEMVGNGM